MNWKNIQMIAQKKMSTNLVIQTNIKTNNQNCIFCKKICQQSSCYSILISKALYSKYSSSQNYYYTKDLNDILNNSRVSQVIQYNDSLPFDDQDEFLKRFYKFHEYPNKIKLLTEYYKYHNDISRIFMKPSSHSLNKYHDKKRKLDYIKITNIMKNDDEQIPDKKKKQQQPQISAIKILQNLEDQSQNQCSIQNQQLEANCGKFKDKQINLQTNALELNYKIKQRQQKQNKILENEQKNFSNSNTIQELNQKLGEIINNSKQTTEINYFDNLNSSNLNNNFNNDSLTNFLNFLNSNNESDQSKQNSNRNKKQLKLDMPNLEKSRQLNNNFFLNGKLKLSQNNNLIISSRNSQTISPKQLISQITPFQKTNIRNQFQQIQQQEKNHTKITQQKFTKHQYKQSNIIQEEHKSRPPSKEQKVPTQSPKNGVNIGVNFLNPAFKSSIGMPSNQNKKKEIVFTSNQWSGEIPTTQISPQFQKSQNQQNQNRKGPSLKRQYKSSSVNSKNNQNIQQQIQNLPLNKLSEQQKEDLKLELQKLNQFTKKDQTSLKSPTQVQSKKQTGYINQTNQRQIKQYSKSNEHTTRAKSGGSQNKQNEQKKKQTCQQQTLRQHYQSNRSNGSKGSSSIESNTPKIQHSCKQSNGDKKNSDNDFQLNSTNQSKNLESLIKCEILEQSSNKLFNQKSLKAKQAKPIKTQRYCIPQTEIHFTSNSKSSMKLKTERTSPINGTTPENLNSTAKLQIKNQKYQKAPKQFKQANNNFGNIITTSGPHSKTCNFIIFLK